MEPKSPDKKERYKCKVVEKVGDFFYIDYPVNIDTNRTVFLLDGTQLKISFVSNDSAYLFESEICGRVMREIPMLKLLFPGQKNVIKIQRRQFVRVETSVDVAVHPITTEFSPFTARTEDISAGGALISTNKGFQFMEGDTIQTWFVLPMQNGDYHYLNLKSKVIRIQKEKGKNDRFSVQFMEIDRHERQALLRFSFDRQLLMKKKGV